MSEINDVKPTSLAHLVGQQGVLRQVSVGVEAAFQDNKKFDDALLVGPPGLGKSQVAGIIAAEMAAQFHEVLGQSIQSIADLNGLLLQATDKSVLHIDEAHELEKPFQVALYLALDKRKLYISGGRGRTAQGIPIADFTLLLSTTDEYALLAPMQQRVKMVLRFEYYADNELEKILVHRSWALGWEVEAEVFAEIAQRSRGTPRLALRLLQSCRRVCRAGGESSITSAHLQEACDLEQVDVLGLGSVEQRYLRMLADGDSRLNVLASRLGLPTRTVSGVTEQFLIRAGLVEKDDQGRRQLTVAGREHLSRTST